MKNSELPNSTEPATFGNAGLSAVFDIHGKEIAVGQNVKFWRFYNQSMSSEDLWGTEPQNSSIVHEEYMEFVTGEVIFYLGAFCIKYGKSITSLKEIIEGTPQQVVHHFMCGFGGEIELMLEDEEFWTTELLEKLPKETEMNNDLHNKYWSMIEEHLYNKCREFEVVS
jgi:hypothetical protein